MIFLTLKFNTAGVLCDMLHGTDLYAPLSGILWAAPNGTEHIIFPLSPESLRTLRSRVASALPLQPFAAAARAAVLLMVGHANDVPEPAPYDPDGPLCV